LPASTPRDAELQEEDIMRADHAIAEILRREGVKYLFCYPYNSLIEACAEVGIQPIVCRQERVGMGMADGYSRITNGNPVGVFTSQHGPGGENAFAGVATAYSDSTPVLVMPHGDDTDRYGVRGSFSPAKGFAIVAKHTELLNRPRRVQEVMRRAFSALKHGRPGPVVVEIPDDVAEEDFEDAALTYQPIKPHRSMADPADVDEAARMLLEARRPVIFAGQGIRFAQATPELIELAEVLQAPVMTTLLGKGSYPEDHPLSAGTASGAGTGVVAHYLQASDTFLCIGTSLTLHNISSAMVPKGKTIIHATNDPVDINKDYTVDHAVVGDAKLVLKQLVEAVRDRLGARKQNGDGTLAAEMAQIRETWMQKWLPKLTSDEVPINPYRVVGELTKLIDPSSAILTHDSGSPRSQLVPFYRAATNGYVGFGKSHALGTGLGLMMGAKLAQPDKFCINWMGDAAFGMVGTDFETAGRNNIPITTLVSNNYEMAVETARMTLSHGKYQTRRTTGNYADMGRAMGGHAEKVETPDQVRPALERALKANLDGRSALVEFITCAETSTSSSGSRSPY
jgi:acetolactate synthase-1/2/3 large subunit